MEASELEKKLQLENAKLRLEICKANSQTAQVTFQAMQSNQVLIQQEIDKLESELALLQPEEPRTNQRVHSAG
jgi:hypothetical protein